MDVRFLIDEHIDHAIAAALRLRGYDVLTLADAGLLSADDEAEILPFALREERVLVTRDSDFLSIHARGEPRSGIVHWHGRKRNVREAIHYLLQLGRKETRESMAGDIRFIKTGYP
jgi:predicted nuclease of predicted toxin-antitoxin system